MTDLPLDIVGSQLKLKIEVTNVGGYSSKSEEVLVVTVSDKPGAPTNGPVSVAEVTSTDRIRVTYGEPDTGGSPIINFELQFDNSVGGGFVTLAGGDDELYQKTYAQVQSGLDIGAYDPTTDSFSYDIISGMPYRFRYRARNVNGWGPFSPVTTIYAAKRPQSPPPIILVSSEPTQLTVKVM